MGAARGLAALHKSSDIIPWELGSRWLLSRGMTPSDLGFQRIRLTAVWIVDLRGQEWE